MTEKVRRIGWVITTGDMWIEDAPAKRGEGINGIAYYLSDDGAPQSWDGRQFVQIAKHAYPYKSKAKAERRAFWIAARCPELVGVLVVKRMERT